MDVTAEDFRRYYESLPDDALMEVDTGELVEVARTCHAEEVAKRGLDAAPAEEEDAGAEADLKPDADEELVCIVEYDYVDEAEVALGLLQSSGINAALEHAPGVERLMVPAGLVEQALPLLVTPLSDEELEAQAEAAGDTEGEEEEEVEE